MKTCSICIHWKAHQETEWGTFSDEKAPCTLSPTKKEAPWTNRNDTCDYCTLTPEQSGNVDRYLANMKIGFYKGMPPWFQKSLNNIIQSTGYQPEEDRLAHNCFQDDSPWDGPDEDEPPMWAEKKNQKADQHQVEEEFGDWDDGENTEMDNLPTSKYPKVDIPLYKEFQHQKEAFERYKDATVIALFLEQGLGKSKIILDIAKYKYKQHQIDALLIVAPNGVHKQWFREQIPKWLQDIPYDSQLIGGKGGKKEGRKFRENQLQIVSTNIDTFSTPYKWEDIRDWANSKKTFIVLDEATVIKNISSKRTERLLYEFNEIQKKGSRVISSRMYSVCRAVLTGTPITNGPFDAWAIFEFLEPNYFKRNYYSFRSHFGMFWRMSISTGSQNRAIEVLINPDIWKRIKEIIVYEEAKAIFGVSESTFNYIHSQEKYEGPFKHVDELKKLMEPVAMFKTLDECVDMPGQLYNRHLLDMDTEQARIYRDMEEQLIAEYQDKVTDAKSKLTAYIRLQQITSGFISSVPEFNLIGDEEIETWEPNQKEITWIGNTNPKLEAIKTDVESCPVPCIVICHFSAEAERLFNELSKVKTCSLQTGWKKVGSIESFQAGEYDCIVANVRCISRGFNLQRASRMFFYSNTFSLEDRLQVESRIYRIGQSTKCEYVDYIMNDTIDMKTVAALRQKKSLLDYVRGTTVKQMLTEVDDVFKKEYSDVRFDMV